MACSVPHGMPILTRGRHRQPTDGACLMEAVALLTGQPFSDRPDGVHPLIGTVARIVNDAVSDLARQRLLRLASSIPGTATDDPAVFDDLVILACDRALPVALPLWAPAIRHALRRAQRRRARGETSIGRWAQSRAAAAVRYATISVAVTSLADRDHRLASLLEDCTVTVHRQIRSGVRAAAAAAP